MSAGRHRVETLKPHLMACSPCWLAWADAHLAVSRQVDERRLYADTGIPMDTHSGLDFGGAA